MIKVDDIDVWGFEHALRGMRNPLNSWAKSDTAPAFHMMENFATDDPMADKYRKWNDYYGLNVKIGPDDLNLMRRLFEAGPEHRKYLRQIFVSMDITAPLYWWKEFDTYKVGTVANSCSTMHKIHAKEFTIDDFSHDHLIFEEEIPNEEYEGVWDTTELDEKYCALSNSDFADYTCYPGDYLNWMIEFLNRARELYLKTKDKKYWWQMIQLLPSSYNQRRTVTMNYENVVTIIRQRTGHKLDEWHQFIDILRTLPYVINITEKPDSPDE